MSANTPLMIHLLIIHFLSHVEMITGVIVSCVFVFAGQMKNISGSTVAKIFQYFYRLWRTGNGKQTSHGQWSQIFLTKFCKLEKCAEFSSTCIKYVLENLLTIRIEGCLIKSVGTPVYEEQYDPRSGQGLNTNVGCMDKLQRWRSTFKYKVVKVVALLCRDV